MTIRDEVLLILEQEYGGEVRDPQGLAARKLFERCATTSSAGVVSTTLKQLDDEGVIVRDMPNMKRCTRIAMNDGRFEPGRKSLAVVSQYLAKTMADTFEQQVQHVVDAQSEARAQELANEQVEAIQQELDLQKQEVKALRSKLASAEAPLQAKIDQLEQELTEVREQLRIAEHNAEVWKRKTRQVNDRIDSIRDRLSPDERRAIDRMMRQTRS